jgi:hypothetical protein
MTRRRTAVVVLVVSVLAAGCTTTVYDKSGATAAEVAQDLYDCQRAARETKIVRARSVAGTINLVFPAVEIDGEAFDDCLEQRGYSARLDD